MATENISREDSSTGELTFRIYVKEDTSFSLSVSGDQVILATPNPADVSQYWVRYDKEVVLGNLTFVLVNRFTGQALKQPSEKNKLVQLELYNPDDTEYDNLLWIERKLGDDYNSISPVDNKELVLDALFPDKKPLFNGNPIGLWENNNGDNQRWKLASVKITYGGVFFGQKF